MIPEIYFLSTNSKAGFFIFKPLGEKSLKVGKSYFRIWK